MVLRMLGRVTPCAPALANEHILIHHERRAWIDAPHPMPRRCRRAADQERWPLAGENSQRGNGRLHGKVCVGLVVQN